VRSRLFTFFSALSLLLCVAVCVLWVDSYLARSGVHRSYRGVVWYAATMDGRFYIGRQEDLSPAAQASTRPPEFGTKRVPSPVPPLPARMIGWQLGVAGWGGERRPRSYDISGFVGPLWLLAAGTALTAWWGWRLARRKSGTPGTCPSCGYDLTGNVSGTCPECGTEGAAT
jgi:hypothetical protein